MIETLLAISACAFLGLALTLIWPRLPRWPAGKPISAQARPQRVLRLVESAASPPAPVRGRAPEELIRRGANARDALARDLSATEPSGDLRDIA